MDHFLTFDEALTITQRIRSCPDWYVLRICPKNGELLDTDTWEVLAVYMRDSAVQHYFGKVSAITNWQRYREMAEKGHYREGPNGRLEFTRQAREERSGDDDLS